MGHMTGGTGAPVPFLPVNIVIYLTKRASDPGTVLSTVPATGPAPMTTAKTLISHEKDPLCSEKLVEIYKKALDETALVFALGCLTLSEEAKDEAPVLGLTGKGGVTTLEEGPTKLFALGKALLAPLIRYLTTSLLDKGVDTPTYTGTNMANRRGKGPELPAREG